MSADAWLLVVVVHAAATWAMVGLIWTVQIVHYPLFGLVGHPSYVAYQREHMRRIAALLAAPWAVEILTTAAAIGFAPTARLRVVAGFGAGLLVAIIGITAVAAAPAHGQLAGGFSPAVHRRLVQINWVRTALWTARGALALMLLWWSVTARPEI